MHLISPSLAKRRLFSHDYFFRANGLLGDSNSHRSAPSKRNTRSDQHSVGFTAPGRGICWPGEDQFEELPPPDIYGDELALHSLGMQPAVFPVPYLTQVL